MVLSRHIHIPVKQIIVYYRKNLFCKNSQRLNTPNYFAKSFILDISLGSEYVSDYRL